MLEIDSFHAVTLTILFDPPLTLAILGQRSSNACNTMSGGASGSFNLPHPCSHRTVRVDRTLDSTMTFD